jgi:hypothetical protein
MRGASLPILLGLIVSSQLAHAQAADRCGDILKQGIFNQFKSLNQANYSSRLKDAVCQSSNSSTGNSSGGGLSVGIPIDGVPIKFGGDYNEKHVGELKQSYCHQGSSALNNDDLQWIMQQIASQEIVSAWSHCMGNYAKSSGLTGAIDNVNGSQFVFKVTWSAAFGVNEATVSSFVVRGASCDPVILTSGTKITTDGIAQPCARSGSEPVSIILNSNHGYAIGVLAEDKPKSLKDKCMEGSYNACATLAKNLRATCKFDAACISRAQCWDDKSRAFILANQECPGATTPQQQQQCEQFKAQMAESHREDCDEK